LGTSRLEVFSDGVLAIVITIMVLELDVPDSIEPQALLEVLPGFLSYVLSFIFLAIYWNNHHHLLQAATRVSGAVLWANSHLLFWLSLVPFATRWMGQTGFALTPVVVYGFVMLMAGFAAYLLIKAVVRAQGPNSVLAKAMRRDWKSLSAGPLLILGIGLAFIHPLLACAIYALVAAMWLIPDRRIEASVAEKEHDPEKV
jgi:uncharacterized membrane protein